MNYQVKIFSKYEISLQDKSKLINDLYDVCKKHNVEMTAFKGIGD